MTKVWYIKFIYAQNVYFITTIKKTTLRRGLELRTPACESRNNALEKLWQTQITILPRFTHDVLPGGQVSDDNNSSIIILHVPTYTTYKILYLHRYTIYRYRYCISTYLVNILEFVGEYGKEICFKNVSSIIHYTGCEQK